MAAPDGTTALPGDVPGCRILEAVGRGGFGVVYRARQERLGRDVAVKMLTVPGLGGDAVARFRREAELLARLTGHPNVVMVLDSGVTRSGLPYLVMPFFERGSLTDRLARSGPLPVGDVLQIGVKIAGALAAAHHEGILHRDVKPQNILVSRYGEPALADFGIARLLDTADAATRTGALTPDHAAPEVLDGQPYGITADVYSLGSTLHQLLAGRPPFRQAEGEGLAPLLLRILTEPPPAIPRPEVPPALRDALQTALAKEPAQRFQQAGDFAARLRDAQAQAGLPAASLAQVPASRPPAGDAGFRPDLTDAGHAQGGPGAGWQPTPPDPDLAKTPDLTEAGRRADGGAPGGAGRDETIARPGRALEAAPAASGRQPGRRWRVTAMAAVIAAVAATVTAVALAGRPHPPRPSASPARRSALPVSASVLRAARPVHLKVVARGTFAVLSWHLAAGSRYPLAIQRIPAGGKAVVQPVGGSDATTTATITGLSPGKGYCFQVGAVVRLGNPSTVAWSRPACVRGAVAAQRH